MSFIKQILTNPYVVLLLSKQIDFYVYGWGEKCKSVRERKLFLRFETEFKYFFRKIQVVLDNLNLEYRPKDNK